MLWRTCHRCGKQFKIIGTCQQYQFRRETKQGHTNQLLYFCGYNCYWQDQKEKEERRKKK